MTTPSYFNDPTSYPFVFESKRPGEFEYFQNAFPVSFSFESSPRHADIATLAVFSKNKFFTDRDIGNDSSMVFFSKGASHRIELFAGDEDLEISPLYLKLWEGSSQPKICYPMSVAHIRQASSSSNISHIFSMGQSTHSFSPVGGLYPTVSLDLSFSPTLLNCDRTWSNEYLLDKKDSLILLNPSGASGVLDILLSVRTRWYTDEARTVAFLGTPPITRSERFGIRFYISDSGLFSNKVQLLEAGGAVAEGMLPQSELNRLGYNSPDILYFGSGTKAKDLFFGKETGVEVDDSGLPIQGSEITPVYILDNLLEDIESSSLNSSSSSSVSSKSSFSSSSSSVSSSSSSSSTRRLTSDLSTESSTQSTTSESSQSNSSSVSSVSSKVSSITSFSSSTKTMTTSLSSPSSSTLVENRLVAFYSFSQRHDEFGNVLDLSGNELNLKIPATGGGIYPPKWSEDYGQESSGGYRFYGNDMQSQYLYRADATRFLMESSGTVSIWIKPLGVSNTIQSIFSISNGFVPSKTEFEIEADYSSLFFRAKITQDGTDLWSIRTQNGSLVQGEWSQFVLVHNGTSPKIYLNGEEATITYEESSSPELWTDSLSPSSGLQLYVGATPRNYAPYMALGLFAMIDEITYWDGVLPDDMIRSRFSMKLSSSSS